VVISQLSSSKSKKKKIKRAQATTHEIAATEEDADESPSLLSKIGDKLVSTATVFLLDLAKEKLSDYLLHKKSKDEDS